MTVSKVPHELAKSQLGFIKYLVQPLIRSYAEFHNNSHWIANVKSNLAEWERRCAEAGPPPLGSVASLDPRHRRSASPARSAKEPETGEGSGAAKESGKTD